MSYVRWSTVINPAISFKEEFELLSNGTKYDAIHKMKLDSEDAYQSKWYIYWHSMAIDSEDESNKKEDQYLAVWYQGSSNTPVLDYELIKEIYESKNWKYFGDDIDQFEVLEDCLKRWIDDVEEDCE